jgi:hypothetical protein
MIPKNEIDKLRELLAAGDQGPWVADIDDPDTPRRMWTGKFYIQGDDQKNGKNSWCTQNANTDEFKHACNAELAAAAVTVLPGLLDMMEHIYMELWEVTCQRDAYRREIAEH